MNFSKSQIPLRSLRPPWLNPKCISGTAWPCYENNQSNGKINRAICYIIMRTRHSLLARMAAILIGVAAIGSTLFAVASALSEPRLDQRLSLDLASSDSANVLRSRIHHINLYRLPFGMHPGVPPDHTKTKPIAILEGGAVSTFIDLLSSGSDRGRSIASTGPEALGCLVFLDEQEQSLPGYIWLTVSVDGRAYVHFYTGRDGLGHYNAALVEWVLQYIENEK